VFKEKKIKGRKHMTKKNVNDQSGRDMINMNVSFWTTMKEKNDLTIRAKVLGMTRSAFIRYFLKQRWDSTIAKKFDPHMSDFAILLQIAAQLKNICSKIELSSEDKETVSSIFLSLDTKLQDILGKIKENEVLEDGWENEIEKEIEA
jgi:hypothetical protein